MSNWRFRTNWRGKLILQREYRVPSIAPGVWDSVWKDATAEDMGDYYRDLYKVKP